MRSHLNYFGVTDNGQALYCFEQAVRKLLAKWMNRRSQRRSFSWESFRRYDARYPLPRRQSFGATQSRLGIGSMKRLAREDRRQASVRGRRTTVHDRMA